MRGLRSIRFASVLLAVLHGTVANGQTVSTRCQATEVSVASATIDLRLVGCGEGFPDNLLWHLDRADSLDGSLDGKLTRTLTGKGAVVYMLDTGVMRDHDEFVRPEGSAVIGAIQANGPATGCGTAVDPALEPCFNSDATLAIFTHGTATASVVSGRNTGIAPDAKIVSVPMSNAATFIDRWIITFDAIIKHAFDPATPQFKTGIINMSFVPAYASSNDPLFPQFEAKMRQMIAGVDVGGNPDPNGKRFLFVTIAGNHVDGNGDQCDAGMSSNLYPGVLGASIDGLITVGGIGDTNHLWDRSCRGFAVDVLAPAASMLVAPISGRDHYRSGKVSTGYPLNSGTSYAGSYVAGLAALLLEKNPDLTPQQLEAIIKATSSRTSNLDEPTAVGRVAVMDMISARPRRHAVRR